MAWADPRNTTRRRGLPYGRRPSGSSLTAVPTRCRVRTAAAEAGTTHEGRLQPVRVEGRPRRRGRPDRVRVPLRRDRSPAQERRPRRRSHRHRNGSRPALGSRPPRTLPYRLPARRRAERRSRSRRRARGPGFSSRPPSQRLKEAGLARHQTGAQTRLERSTPCGRASPTPEAFRGEVLRIMPRGKAALARCPDDGRTGFAPTQPAPTRRRSRTNG